MNVRTVSPIALNLARFDLVSIRLAVDCAHSGSLTSAARQSNLALAAASRRLKELEEALGLPLFERRAKGLQPTAAAGAFLKHAWDILSSVRALELELVDLREGVARHVRMCASSAAINQFLPPLLALWQTRHPQVRVEIEEQVSAAVLTRLHEGRADVGVFVDGPDSRGLRIWPFREDELVVVFSRKHALAATAAKTVIGFDTLLEEQWISLGSGAAMLQAQQRSAIVQGKPLKIRMQLRSFDAICHMVEANMGIALLPKTAVLPNLQTMKLGWRSLADAWARRRMVLATTSGQSDPTVLRLVDFLAKDGQPEPSHSAKGWSEIGNTPRKRGR